MQALMGKSNKAPTPQELYRARKQKEETERSSFLPPGLVNHGNTCFMNSVLQGLIATPMLADIVRFSLPGIYAPILSRRSPQLTNGHGQGGAAEREWEQGMPLGDIFVHLMLKAWNAQDERSRLSMSPKDLLSRIGAKFDQYLDFRQQDAHEFLRHLLDAMRMEELDIIKKRQPRPPKTKRRKSKKGNDVPRSSSPELPNIPEEDRLTSFVDMVFGGRLASILVCEKCKKISFTYEDFNDLSLSIKQEDYEKARKRDKLKSLARKLGMRGRGATRDLDSSDNPRSSSVPSSPLRRSEEAERSFELVLNDVGHRRRSLEAGEETPSLKATFQEDISQEPADVPYEQMVKDRHRALGLLEEGKVVDEDESQKEEPRREKDEDGWVKLRRKITVSMGVKKAKRKSGPKEALSDLQSNDESQAEATGDEAMDSYVDVKVPSPSPASPAMSPLLGASNALQRLPFVRRPSSRVDSPSISAVTSPARSPDLPSVTLPPPELRPPSPTPAPAEPIRSKSPRPPKQSASEAAYLRRLLADVPSTSSTTFNLFRTSPLSNSSPEVSDTRAAWPKLGHVQSVEGCLRLFTAVEVLDGENMVGCRRCWKIKNGVYNPSNEDAKRREKDEEDDEEADADDNDERSSSSGASVKISLVDGDDSRPQSLPSASTGLQLSSLDIHERNSLRSAPPTSSNNRSLENDGPQAARLLNAGTSSSPSINVPSISMTAPEPTHAPAASEQTPVAEVPPENALRGHASARLVSSPSRDSLQLPTTTRHFRQPAERASSSSITSDTSSLSSDGSGDEAEETETSLNASVHSDSSSVESNRLELRTTKPNALSNSTIDHTPRSSMSRQRRKSSGGIPRAKQVVMRRAYKRYLIATPPPVLVIHLKRFQQVGRSPTQLQFFTNFKKLDDPVSFPEYLDLSPYLLPSREEQNGKSKKKKSKEEKPGDENRRKDSGTVPEGCMYRLYAVIVHIGNMLGGHYVAYTALPEAAPSTKEDYSSISSSTSVDSVRPEIPRTTSFARTANPHASAKSRTSSNNSSSAQRQWCYVSDTVVRLATLEEVLQAKAYICMYERI